MSLQIDENTQTQAAAPAVAPAPMSAEVAKTAPPAGTPEYETWVTERAQASLAAKEQKENDGLILGKFKTPDDLANAYKELQAEYTRVKQGKAPETPTEQTQTEAPKEGQQEQAKTEPVKVDRQKYTAEIATTGALSDASYAELEKAGYDRDMVNDYIEGQKARLEKQEADILSGAGIDRQGYSTLAAWAKTNLQQAELESFNSQLRTGGGIIALQWLKSKFEAVNGAAPKNVISGYGAPTSSNGFASRMEAIRAMQDKRYDNDPAYRAEVERKLANRTY